MRMYLRTADNTLLAGGAMSFLSSVINFFSPSEWMVIGIIIGIFFSVLGYITGFIFRCRRERLLRQWIDYRRSRADELVTPEEVDRMWED
ncbi:lysis protein [Edwardsiella hoshinae]|nr:lysis protein [Edwardsiella hoshinae]